MSLVLDVMIDDPPKNHISTFFPSFNSHHKFFGGIISSEKNGFDKKFSSETQSPVCIFFEKMGWSEKNRFLITRFFKK